MRPALLVVVLCACGSPSNNSGSDAAIDGAPADAELDTQVDAPLDAPSDPPPAPACSGTPLVPVRPLTPVNEPREIVSANFDGDNDDDIATVSNGMIHVFLTNDDGTFAVTAHPTFGVLDVLRVADWDGDGDFDLLSVDRTSDLVRVLSNTNGAFAEITPVATIDDPVKLAVGDVDGDGDRDLVVGSTTTVAVMLTGGSALTVPIGTSVPGALELVDVDADGDRDVVMLSGTSGTTQLHVFHYTNGAFAQPVTTSRMPTRVLVTADIDGDGDGDAFTSESTGVVLLRGNGDGTFATAVTVAPGLFEEVRLVDSNSDGKLDLVASDRVDGTIMIRDGAGDGTFGAERRIPGNDGLRLTVGRFDSDTLPDVAFAGYHGIEVFRGEANGNVRRLPRFEVASGPGVVMRKIAPADFDLDGDVDLAVAYTDYNDSFLAIVINTAGQFTVSDIKPFARPSQLLTADVDGDHRLDVVGTGAIARNTSSGWVVTNLPVTPKSSVRTGDVDGDGNLDLVVGSIDGWAVLRNTPTGFVATQYPDDLAVSAIVDIDGDSRADLLTSATHNPYTFHVRLGNGNGTFGAPTPMPVEAKAVDDLDGDGHLDLVGATPSPPGQTIGPVSIAYGNGNGTFGAAMPLDGVPFFSGDLRVVDFDRDGTKDVVTMTTGTMLLLRRTGSGTYRPPIMYGTGGADAEYVLADLDRSGTLDLARLGIGRTLSWSVTMVYQVGCEP